MDGFQLISAYVLNFGVLNEFSYSFTEGVNIVEEENGWGKSTFAAFLKAMLFGMEYTKGTKNISERKRYEPYLGKGYGGTIVFSYKEGTYRLERTFGKTDRDDTFIVTDLRTNLPSSEFGTNLGEEIWKIDRESYEKSSYITLEESDFLSDVISQKLGDIKDQEADMEQSSYAKKVIDKMMISIKAKKGKSGLLGQSQETIRSLEEKRRECINAVAHVAKLEEEIGTLQKEYDLVGQEVKGLDQQLQTLSLVGKKEHYLAMQEALEEVRQQYKIQVEFFKGEVPTNEQLDQMEHAVSKHDLDKARRKEYTCSQEESLELGKQYPTLDQVDACEQQILTLAKQKAQFDIYESKQEDITSYEKLKRKFVHTNVTVQTLDSYLDQYEFVETLRQEKSQLMGQLESVASTGQKQSSLLLGWLFLIGSALCCTISFIVTTYLLLPVILLAVLGIIFMIKEQKKRKIILAQKKETDEYTQKICAIESSIETGKKEYEEFLLGLGASITELPKALYGIREELRELKRLKKDMGERIEQSKALQESIKEIEQDLSSFFAQYGLERENKTDVYLMQQLRESIARQVLLQNKAKQYKEATIGVHEAECTLKPFLSYYFGEIVQDAASMYIRKLRNGLTELALSEKEVNAKEQALLEFKNENDMDLLTKEVPCTMNLQEIQSLRSSLEEKRELLLQNISNKKKDCEKWQEQGDLLEDIESQIDQEKAQYEELSQKYECLQCAYKSLEEAKEELAIRYKAGTERAFQKYLSKIDSKDFGLYEIDIKLNVLYQEAGSMHGAQTLSKGKLDLVRICLRMALVEAIYKDVTNPVLILDDPFVNLDGKRLNAALDLMKDIGREYQVIYFVCHTSRRGQ